MTVVFERIDELLKGQSCGFSNDLVIEVRQPDLRISTVASDNVPQSIHGGATTRDHRELCVESFEIKLADDALMVLLHEKASGAWLKLLLDEPELPLGKAKAPDIIPVIRVKIGKEDLCRRLLDQSPTDRTFQNVTRALCRKRHHAV